MNLFFHHNIWLLLCLACISFIVLSIIRTSSRHKKNIVKSKKILLLIRSFNGEYHEAKIFTYLRKISPYVFEELLLTVFEERGFNTVRNKRYSGDGGLDGKVYNKNGELFLIQAKRYKGLINPKHIKEFQLCILKNQAKGGYFIHTGRTAKEHLNNFRYSNIDILSGNKLIKFIKN